MTTATATNTAALEAQLGDGHRVHERLGHRLDRERSARVSGAVHLAVDADDRYAESVGVDVGELGDVRGDCSRHVVAVSIEDRCERIPNGIEFAE